MNDAAKLSVDLSPGVPGVYHLELGYYAANSDAEIRSQPQALRIDSGRSSFAEGTPEKTGRALSRWLFGASESGTFYAQAVASARAVGAPLRIRLNVRDAPELHCLPWELLRDPLEDFPLAAAERVWFSRYLASLDWRPVPLRPKGSLQALVVVANPTNLHRYQLAPVDVTGEKARIGAALQPVAPHWLVSGDTAGPTAANLYRCLHEAEYDVVYLVCHGTMKQGETWLWLENERGEIERLAGSQLAAFFTDLLHPPRLVVLVSCQSAGKGGEDAVYALGPRLAGSGIPAVLAMQGQISIETIGKMMPVFFDRLLAHGEIDRAVSEARCAVRSRPDFWVPALFSRLESGRVWAEPALAVRGEAQAAIAKASPQGSILQALADARADAGSLSIAALRRRTGQPEDALQAEVDRLVKLELAARVPRRGRGALILYEYAITDRGLAALRSDTR